MKRYHLTAQVTISLHATVYAETKREALELAADLVMPTIHEDTRYERPGVSDEEWRTRGELDGTARRITAEEEGD